MIKKFAFALLALFFLPLTLATPAHASLKIDITRGHAQPLPIAIVDFLGKNRTERSSGQQVAEVISNNLSNSGLFAPIDQESFIQTADSLLVQPRFGDWRIINTQALVYGKVEMQEDGRLRVEFRLWDVFAEQQLVGQAFYTEPDNWRRIAHVISDKIYERLTGEDGYFDSRLVYIAESGNARRRVKRLAIMDQDGANHRYLTDGNTLVLTPRFSPTAQKITYMAYYSNRPRVYILDIDTGREEVLGDFPGMTFAPRFSPDGKSVIMSLSHDGNADIYLMNLETRRIRQLTTNSAIDTSPSMSPDGKRIVFSSDRGGSPQLYTMDVDGSNLRRVSFGNGRYNTPVWSPRGDMIAFTRQLGGTFYIGVMRTDGSGERLLTESYLDEGPTWSPNGRVISFFRQERMSRYGDGKTRLFTVDLTGYNLREMQTPNDASDPAWSPLLPIEQR